MTGTSTVAIPETVTVSSEAVLESIAALIALDNYFHFLTGYAVDSKLGNWCTDHVGALYEALGESGAAGAAPSDQDELDSTWPPEVESQARGAEKTAELLELHIEMEAELAREKIAYGVYKEVKRARAEAQAIRGAGSTDISKLRAAGHAV